ncbi:hypothetical protein DERF_008791 [Dermatophagoides farinae]|uniref:Uncharacterized protein n=1 Tax=Dermatophagoides farinae TaxID=6954 RepID=A0A922I458_DERFA|nr:hypothetical protein DERF_008791 [Dermatophagoides farinae]
MVIKIENKTCHIINLVRFGDIRLSRKPSNDDVKDLIAIGNKRCEQFPKNMITKYDDQIPYWIN